MDSRADVLFSQVLAIIAQLPLFLVWLVGLILAITRWGRHPRISGLVLVAVFAAAGATFGAQIAFRLVPLFFDAGDFGRLFPLISMFFSLIHAGAWICLLAAAFGGRADAQQTTPFAANSTLPPKDGGKGL
jgi:hypothetical protein